MTLQKSPHSIVDDFAGYSNLRTRKKVEISAQIHDFIAVSRRKSRLQVSGAEVVTRMWSVG